MNNPATVMAKQFHYTPQQLSRMSEHQIASLNADQIAALSPQHLICLRKEQIRALRDEQVTAITDEQIWEFEGVSSFHCSNFLSDLLERIAPLAG